MIKLICIDLDGTLLNSNKEISKETIIAIKYAVSQGIEVAIATGRSWFGTRDILCQAGLKETAICLNGGLIVCENKVIYKNFINEEEISKIISIANQNNSQLYLSRSEDTLTAGQLSNDLKFKIEKGVMKDCFYICRDYLELKNIVLESGIIKASVQELETEQYERIREEVSKISTLRAVKSDVDYLDINPANTRKDVGVDRLAKYIGINMKDVMCIGDNENDYEMIREAGIGIAMGNGTKETKMVADYVTDDNDNDGVAKAIYKYIKTV